LPTTYIILSNILLSRLTPYAEEIIGDYHCGFRVTGQLLITCTAFVKYLRKGGREYNEAVHQLVIDFKKAYYISVGRKVFYNLTEFGIPMKPVRLIKICLNKTISGVRVVKAYV